MEYFTNKLLFDMIVKDSLCLDQKLCSDQRVKFSLLLNALQYVFKFKLIPIKTANWSQIYVMFASNLLFYHVSYDINKNYKL